MPRNFGKEVRAARAREMMLTIAAIVSILIGRLVYLQLVEGSYYWSLSEENRVRVEEVRAPRGRILDRSGAVLANNSPSYRITLDTRHGVFRKEPARLDQTVEALAAALELEPERLAERVERQGRESSLPVVIARSVPFAQVSRVEERTVRLEGVSVEVIPMRRYPEGELACHLLGYLGEVQRRDLEENPDGPYRVGHLIGRTGVEREYESELRGSDGKAFVEVDVHGRHSSYFPELPSAPALAGHDLVLTIDLRVQAVAESALAAIVREGAAPGSPPPPACVVAIDPRNGEVLALASQPGFDPNVFLGGLSPEEYRALLAPDKPQHNRAIASTYPPASTFKAVTSLAALEGAVVTRRETVEPCSGSYQFGNRRFGCWKKGGHGSLDLDGALRRSCDVYYYQVGIRLGMDRLSEYARRCGLAELTGVDLPGERADLIPDRVWYDEHRTGWGRGVVLNLAIGQGELLISPIALTRFFAALGQEGQIYQPHVLLEVRAPDGTVLRDTRRDDWRAGRLEVSPENLAVVREGLEQVVMHAEGTGHRARVGEIHIAGKTGTAENPTGFDHALFACYAPAEAPRIAIVVVAEESGHGGAVAAPVAAQVLEAFFRASDADAAEANESSARDRSFPARAGGRLPGEGLAEGGTIP